MHTAPKALCEDRDGGLRNTRCDPELAAKLLGSWSCLPLPAVPSLRPHWLPFSFQNILRAAGTLAVLLLPGIVPLLLCTCLIPPLSSGPSLGVTSAERVPKHVHQPLSLLFPSHVPCASVCSWGAGAECSPRPQHLAAWAGRGRSPYGAD